MTETTTIRNPGPLTAGLIAFAGTLIGGAAFMCFVNWVLS